MNERRLAKSLQSGSLAGPLRENSSIDLRISARNSSVAIAARETDDAVVCRQNVFEPEIVHRRHQHALDQVAAGAEEDDVARVGDAAQVTPARAGWRRRPAPAVRAIVCVTWPRLSPRVLPVCR